MRLWVSSLNEWVGGGVVAHSFWVGRSKDNLFIARVVVHSFWVGLFIETLALELWISSATLSLPRLVIALIFGILMPQCRCHIISQCFHGASFLSGPGGATAFGIRFYAVLCEVHPILFY